jgi:hypothetical protein
MGADIPHPLKDIWEIVFHNSTEESLQFVSKGSMKSWDISNSPQNVIDELINCDNYKSISQPVLSHGCGNSEWRNTHDVNVLFLVFLH